MSLQSIILGSLKDSHFSTIIRYLFYFRTIVELLIPYHKAFKRPVQKRAAAILYTISPFAQ